MGPKNSGYIRLTGFLLGCALAVGLVLSGRTPEGHAGSPASLTISSKPTTELGVSPAGELLSERNLKPGGRQAHATVGIANFTAHALPVRLRVASTGQDLDRILVIELGTPGKRLFRGRLGELRSWSKRPLRLAPRQKRRVEIRAWIPASVRDGYQGRSADVELEWKAGG